MSEKPIKKVNAVYFILAVFVPVVVIVLVGWLGYVFFREGGSGAVICFMCPAMLSVAWWILGPALIWKSRKKKMMEQLSEQGFTCNHTFYGSGQTVAVDVKQGKIALLLFWNPFVLYTLTAGRIAKAWTEDGAAGAGFMRGTNRVRFAFLVDGITVKVNTFTSNQRWKMDDVKVLEGISKADMMVQVLEAAKERAGG